MKLMQFLETPGSLFPGRKMYRFGITVITTLYLVLRVGAQIPMPCASNYTGSTGGPRYCCPVAKVNGQSMGACGSETGRGECIAVSNLCNSEYETVPQQAPDCRDIDDKRLNWPTQFFTHVCRCNGNYGDYDCASCSYGYSVESGCTETFIAPRRSITSLSDDEWKTYLDILNKSKHETSTRYVALNGTEDGYTPTSIYDLFVWFHHYAAKNHLNNYLREHTGCDYAHDATGFLTWHRIYLLWFERELQILSKDPSFRVSYWNWTDFEGESDWTGLLFNDNKLGGYDSDGLVTGPYFSEENWKTVCVDSLNEICNPTKTTGPLIRCPVGDHCTSNYDGWPKRADIDAALKLKSFSDPSIFNKYSENDFANYAEGYLPSGDCGDSTICNIDSKSNVSFHRKLHNPVHIILGIGSLSGDPSSLPFVGTMGDSAGSPSDPVFFNHHAMVDYILEEWLQSQDNPSYQGPTNSQFPGHAAGDCAVPFIPVYTHSDIFRSAEHFGYYYADSTGPPDSNINVAFDSIDDSGSSSMLGSFLLVTSIALLSLIITLLN